MVAVGPNMFYTVTLPCTLWFFDKGKGENAARRHTCSFVDARHIYRQVDRAHREWTPAQIGFLANLVRLYRGEALDFTLGGDEARAKLEEIFGNETEIRRRCPACAAPPRSRKSKRKAGRSTPAATSAWRRRSRERRGLQGTTRNAERGTRNPQRPGARPRTNHRRQRGGDSGGVTMARLNGNRDDCDELGLIAPWDIAASPRNDRLYGGSTSIIVRTAMIRQADYIIEILAEHTRERLSSEEQSIVARTGSDVLHDDRRRQHRRSRAFSRH